MSPLRWNVLTDRWIPLDDGHGHPSYASYAELMTGASDAPDLVHPRDDCRFFARMLLSALTQAFFPAADRKELRQRIKSPLSRDLVLRRIEEVQDDFELVGPSTFLQTPLSSEERAAAKSEAEISEPATALLFAEVPRKSRHTLFRPATRCDALCLSCATIQTYGCQAFAMEEGKSGFGLRGKSPSVRGAPATTTLIGLPSLRESTWANVLHGQRPLSLSYAPDRDRPWRQARTEKTEGAAFGLLEGLFWQPRAFQLECCSDGQCFACGTHGPRLAPVAWRSKSRAADGAFFRHPWSPVREDVKTRALSFVHLSSDRPAWAGLVDLLSATAGGASRGERLVHSAPVVQQWHESLEKGTATLLVFDIGTTKSDRATPASRLFEGFPLSPRFADRNVADAVQDCVAGAEKALEELRKACVRLHLKARPNERLSKIRGQRERNEMDRLHDATATFWQRTEPFFWAAYEAFTGEDSDAAASAQAELRAQTRGIALELFDTWAAPSLGDPSRIAHVVQARAWLSRQLPAAHSPVNPSGEGAP